MKWLLILILGGVTAFSIVKTHGPKETQTRKTYRSFAILELFTSEGCSSCPAADRLLPELAALDANVIPLSFHVDYWDKLGWKDSFSNSQFTDRQNDYGQYFKLQSIYTPQLIINGQFELVGSDKATAEADIKKILSENATVELAIDQVKKGTNKLSVNCHLAGDWGHSDLLAAIVQDHAETDVKGGENHGAKLSHTNVVRTFLKLPAKEKMNFEMTIPTGLSPNNSHLILFTQQKHGLKITGAAVYKFTE
jgi:hypothetical protein